MSIVSKLKQITSISDNATEWLSDNLETFNYKKGEVLLKAGQVCHYLYYVNSGMVGAYYLKDLAEICNWISIENDLGTSYYSFITRQPSYETIETFEPSTVQAISYTRLHQMYKLFPETERAGRLILEDYYARLEERLISIQFKSAKERYELLMNKRPEIIRRAPLGRVATYLGMKQETLSRIRSDK